MVVQWRHHSGITALVGTLSHASADVINFSIVFQALNRERNYLRMRSDEQDKYAKLKFSISPKTYYKIS
ncbi:hypothetical protein CKAN_01907700 [Cinnamomum micranthum f. kanehirae]|uniref:Uncharacterized protein n=1 Tax=Cinnamomum micranthum f. kanehirae TaxID=337451 RepID=A0A3S3NZT8_9MAGN|nr:hypothetical protein CKAN_01907700 [Cinnamomum micranthum f. kanehirae]